MQRLILFTSLVLLPLLIQAQEFAVKPANLQFPLEPLQSGYRTLTLTNLSDETKTYQLSVGDFEMDTLGNLVRMDPGASKYSCAKWITFEPATFELAPNESRQIRVTISVPANENGTRWAELYFQAQEELADLPALADRAMQSQLKAQSRIAVPVLQSPPSNTNYDAEVANLRLAERNDTTAVFHADLINKGEKLVTGRIMRSATNLDTGASFKLPPVDVAILPGVRRILDFRFDEVLPKGNYLLTAVWQVDYQKSPKGSRLQIQLN
ncbi:MAG: hypothetical protein KIPDCIKN_00677 [Haliscomenobacter sp.]|nr:hypothetical protein [Haliscomenobacter sp.]